MNPLPTNPPGFDVFDNQVWHSIRMAFEANDMSRIQEVVKRASPQVRREYIKALRHVPSKDWKQNDQAN